MKKWKIVRTITLIILLCFIIFAGYIIIGNLLERNYYNDIFGATTFYWYERAWMIMMLYLYILWIPLLVDVIIFIISIIKIKNKY